MTHDARLPARERCVLRYLLDARAQEAPDETFVIFEGGKEWTHAELRSYVRSTAAGLEGLGVRQGEHVV